MTQGSGHWKKRHPIHRVRLGLASYRFSSLRPVLKRDGPDDHLMVEGSQESADEGADPEDPLQSRKLMG
jgi:hypothetical protein